MLNFYNATAGIQENTILNRGIMDLGGYSIPSAIMANNPVERKERLTKSTIYFIIAFLSPLITLPISNKFALSKLFKITENYGSSENEIIKLSNKYLNGSVKKMIGGIKELSEDLLKKKKDVKGFDTLLERYKGRENLLRKKLIKAKNTIFASDYLFTGVLTGSVSWIVNKLTKKMTGRTGFSAEYKMADDNYTKKQAQPYEKNKLKKYLSFLAVAVASSIIIPLTLGKSMLSKNPKGLFKILKENAHKFDYVDGKYMSLLTYFSIFLTSESPGVILSGRDKSEMKDWATRLGVIGALFFGGDAALNSTVGRVLDKKLGTMLVDVEKMKKPSLFHKIFPPIRSFKEIEKLKGVGEEVLTKTKKYATRMYWGNFLAIMLTMGIGMPHFLNLILRKNTEQNLKKMKIDNNHKIFRLIKQDKLKENIFKDFLKHLN